MKELKLFVPTYLANITRSPNAPEFDPDFGSPYVPILIHEAEGIRIVLGTHDYTDPDKPDVQIERRPNGWAIFLHPVGGCDASGYVYFLDDGRSFLKPERGFESSRRGIKVLDPHDDVPDVDRPQLTTEANGDEVMPNTIVGAADPPSIGANGDHEYRI